MEGIYRVVNIEGKGSGCIALQDLKKGTLVLDEKPQCIAKKHPDGSRDLKSVIQSFACMSKNDQEEYLRLEEYLVTIIFNIPFSGTEN